MVAFARANRTAFEQTQSQVESTSAAAPAEPVDGPGCRYLPIVPPAGTEPVALLVEPACEGGVAKYVGEPRVADPVDHNRALLQDTSTSPVFKTPAEWLRTYPAVYVFGPDIVPNREYHVRVDYGTVGCPVLSEALDVTTAIWGDTAGVWDPGNSAWGLPDGVVRVTDVMAGIDAFRGLYWWIPFHRADVESYSCVDGEAGPSRIDILDIARTIDAFRGGTYEEAFPECPDPCAAAAPSGPANPYYFTGRRLDLHQTHATTGEDELVLYHYRARAYDALNGRFLQRDPLMYVDGMNLYEYVASRPTTFMDPLGLWRIEREGDPRALAISDPRDTVDGLAQIIKLTTDEYAAWLWEVDLTEGCCEYPDSAYDSLEGDCEFSIPNTVALIWGALPGYDSWYHPVSIYGQFWRNMRAEREGFRSKGYYIDELDSPTAAGVVAALQNRDLHVFLYAGHGGADGSLVPQPPADVNPRVAERDYRTGGLYRLAGMKLLACYSANLSNIEATRNAPNLNTWRDNVSDRGVFVGYIGEAGFWSSNPYVDAPPP